MIKFLVLVAHLLWFTNVLQAREKPTPAFGQTAVLTTLTFEDILDPKFKLNSYVTHLCWPDYARVSKVVKKSKLKNKVVYTVDIESEFDFVKMTTSGCMQIKGNYPKAKILSLNIFKGKSFAPLASKKKLTKPIDLNGDGKVDLFFATEYCKAPDIDYPQAEGSPEFGQHDLDYTCTLVFYWPGQAGFPEKIDRITPM